MRVLPVLFAAMVFTTPALAEKPTPEASASETKVTFEADTYRYGDLYRSERGTSVEACAMMCSRDSACASWSLTPATFRLGPRCELKHTPGAASHRPGAVSGMSELWQMNPGQNAEMRYQPRVPESRQPAAVPLEQLRPSPVPRVFGDPPPVREPELMGGPKTRISAVMRPPATTGSAQPDVIYVPAENAAPKQVTVAAQTPTPAPKPPVEVLRGPAQGAAPDYVKQPVQVAAHPLYRTPPRFDETPKAPTVFRDPAREQAPVQPTTDAYNAVLKRERQAPVARPAVSPAETPVARAVQAAPVQLAPARAPWTDRDGEAPDYSVSGTDFIPGDEDATAGFVEGVPEAGS